MIWVKNAHRSSVSTDLAFAEIAHPDQRSVVAKAEGIVGDAGGGGDEGGGGGGAEVAVIVVGAFAFVRAAVDFMAASSAVTGSGVMTVVGAAPASPDWMELDSFTVMRIGTLCG